MTAGNVMASVSDTRAEEGMDPAAEPVSILLVDDRPEQLQVLRMVLEDMGHDLVEATSGSAALKYLLDHDPAVVVLDTQMPVMDGFETAALIRAREKSRNTPIILQTAYDKDDELVSKGYVPVSYTHLTLPTSDLV